MLAGVVRLELTARGFGETETHCPQIKKTNQMPKIDSPFRRHFADSEFLKALQDAKNNGYANGLKYHLIMGCRQSLLPCQK